MGFTQFTDIHNNIGTGILRLFCLQASYKIYKLGPDAYLQKHPPT